MELNHDCVREVLLAIEEQTSLDNNYVSNGISLEDLFKYISSYDDKGIVYTVKKLKEANFINCTINYASGKIYYSNISSLTYQGHELLDNIRDAKTFSKVKNKILDKVGSASLTIVSNVAAAYIKAQLGI